MYYFDDAQKNRTAKLAVFIDYRFALWSEKESKADKKTLFYN